MSADFIFGWSYIIIDYKLLLITFLLFPFLTFNRSGWTKLFTYGMNIYSPVARPLDPIGNYDFIKFIYGPN